MKRKKKDCRCLSSKRAISTSLQRVRSQARRVSEPLFLSFLKETVGWPD